MSLCEEGVELDDDALRVLCGVDGWVVNDIVSVLCSASVQLDHRPAETAPDTSQSVKR